MKNSTQMPQGLLRIMIKKIIRNYGSTEDPGVRAQYGYLAGWISVIVNLILAGVKFVLGYSINSRSLIADAFHSLSDVITSAVVIFGFLASKKPRDKEHPFGHANAELIAALVMSVLLIIAGVELLQSNALKLIQWEFNSIEINWWIISLILLTILTKEWLFSVSKNLGLAIDSKALDTDAWHHRLDSLTTLIVLVGIICSSFGLLWMDSAVGVLVALVVIWSGVEFAMDSISPLLGEHTTHDELKAIHDIVCTDPDILNIHDVIVHKYGKIYFITLHIEISSSLSSVQMHDIAAAASDRISKVFKGACTAHVDPIDSSGARYQTVSAILLEVVSREKQLFDFHDLQFRERENGKERIQWEFSVDPEINEKIYPQIKAEIASYLQSIWPESDLNFSLEPGYNILKDHQK